MKERKAGLCVVLLSGLISLTANAARIGDTDMKYNSSLYDSRYPVMKEWAKAGVEGGIPALASAPIKKTIWATNSDGINNAINNVANSGGGVLLLKNGTYTVNKVVNVKSNVRVVGESRSGTKLNITMKGSSGAAIEFTHNVHHASLERMTIQGAYGQPNDYSMTTAKSDFQIDAVYLKSNSRNCWIDSCTILNVGKHPITTYKGEHHTIRDCYIERAWNKGSGGQGYVSLGGAKYCLFYNNTVKKIRHFAIQNSAKHNVVIGNKFEVDINFHNGDDGYNLIESNNIDLPSQHPWPPYATGGAQYGHQPPGPNNYIYKNTALDRGNNSRPCSNSNIIYTFTGFGTPQTTSLQLPAHRTFYPVSGPTVGAPIGKTIALKSKGSNKYVKANGAGTGWTLQATNGSVGGSWEKFKVEDAGGGYVALKSLGSNNYVKANGSGSGWKLQAINPTIGGSWEKFQWLPQSDGTIALKSQGSNKYVKANGSGTGWTLQAINPSVGGSWEKFTVEIQ